MRQFSQRLVTTMLVALAGQAASAEVDLHLQQIESYVSHYVDIAAFDGVVLIADGDEVVWQKAFGYADYSNAVPMTSETVFRIASLSKQVTQAAIGRLVDQDKVRLDSRLSDFLPEFPNGKRISIRQLLDHTSGIAHTNRLDWLDMRTAMALDQIVARLADEPLLFSPGQDQQYSNGGYALLAKIIEVASGQSYENFIDDEIAARGFPSIGHESAYKMVSNMSGRYAPGAIYGERVVADTYMTSNRIGGGSLYAEPEDVFRFFRASFNGALLSEETTAAIFEKPEDGDTQITGRSPGALAQIYMDFDGELTVLTMSSNSAWPGSFNADIVALYRGEEAALTPVTLSGEALSEVDVAAVTGDFVADRFGWEVSIVAEGDHLIMARDEIRTAFARTIDGEFHLPIYDWLCRYSDYGVEFVCRQRDPDAEIRFTFQRR